ncbi:MAG: MoaD/ThiS family protein [Verrucomicrobiota bacterium]|nr:MoaD/ThiS family protein [Verrucomicrobiota bacterium]
MKIRVQFFSHLKDLVRASELEVDVAEEITAGELLDLLYSRYARMRDWDSSILIGAGVEFVERNHVLRPDDEISIMPPVQGG